MIINQELRPLVCNKIKDVADHTITDFLERFCKDLWDDDTRMEYSDYFYWNIVYVVDHEIAKIFDSYKPANRRNRYQGSAKY